MRIPVSFITTYEFDEFIEQEAKSRGITKSEYIEEVLRKYIEKVKNKTISLEKFIFTPRSKMFLSVKLNKDLNWEMKRIAVLEGVAKQDIFNCAIREEMNDKRNKK